MGGVPVGQKKPSGQGCSVAVVEPLAHVQPASQSRQSVRPHCELYFALGQAMGAASPPGQ
jgi:hypothetical protein